MRAIVMALVLGAVLAGSGVARTHYPGPPVGIGPSPQYAYADVTLRVEWCCFVGFTNETYTQFLTYPTFLMTLGGPVENQHAEAVLPVAAGANFPWQATIALMPPPHTAELGTWQCALWKGGLWSETIDGEVATGTLGPHLTPLALGNIYKGLAKVAFVTDNFPSQQEFAHGEVWITLSARE